jgi:phage-related protein
MANPETEVQKFVTEPIIDLIEFDFTSIPNRTEHVYIASSLDYGSGPQTGQQIKFTWQGHSFEHIDFQTSGLSSSLTGGISEPGLTVSADLLFSLASWPNLSLIEYRGVIVKRRRVFKTSQDAVQPETYYIKKVATFDASIITFVLTPSRSFERQSRPSARKLEI